jgi:hypothetical protein
MHPTAKIRELKRKDRRILAEMIRKLADKIGDKSLLNLMVTDSEASASDPAAVGKKDQFSKIGIEIVKLLIETLETDVSAWFADLLGVTVEQFDEMPFDVELQIIDQLISAEESNRFFTTASQLSSRMRESAARLSGRKTT